MLFVKWITNLKFIWTITFVLATLSVFAITDPIVTKPLLGSEQQVQLNKESYNKDFKYFSLTPAQKTSTFTKVINNVVGIGIEETNTFYIPSSFTVTINLLITTYDKDENQITSITKPFTVNFDKTDNAKYNNLNYYSFQDAYAVRVKIVSIDSGAINWPVSNVLKIENQLEAVRDYPFSCMTSIPGLTIQLDVENKELFTVWQQDINNPNPGITEYDLEWAWVDEVAIQGFKVGSSYLQQKIFANNATRVTVNNLSYSIPLLYDDTGRIFIRVRPVQQKIDGIRVEGAWTWIQDMPSQPQPDTWATPVNYLFLGGHESSLNWQARTSFAEEGKRKSVVQYFDGSLRSRQTVTKDNTTNKTVVAESFYDYQGRPVIQVLPAPTLNTAIGFAKNFNQALQPGLSNEYPKWAYDKLNLSASICNSPAQPFNTDFGTANYYSPKNTLKTQGMNQYIPDATPVNATGNAANESYAFTESRIAPDGRIAAQSGVGIFHQIGSNHETKYYYEAPAQEELDALFGNDAGYASHYFKNIVKDANGQYSVSYVDMHGRTVATALAGGTPKEGVNSIVDPLASQNEQSFTKELLDAETNRIEGNSIISSKPLVVLKANAYYKFQYTLSPKQLTMLACSVNGQPAAEICYDCLYTLKFTITNDCGGEVVYSNELKNFTIGEYLTQCNPNQNASEGFYYSFPEGHSMGLSLAEGSYMVTKELTLSTEAKNAYRDIFLANDTCKKFIEFYNQELQLLIANSNCEMTCESCHESIGVNFAAFRAKFVTESGMVEPLEQSIIEMLQTSYNEAYKNCARLCVDTNDGMDEIRNIKEMMLQDVTPPLGQYANPQNSNKAYNIFKIPDPSNIKEVFYPTPNLPDYQNPINYTPFIIIPQREYKDAFGQKAIDQSELLLLNKEAFIEKFQSSWADQLLPHHPEFKKLKLAEETLQATYLFEEQLKRDSTWAQAVSHNFIVNLVDNDPFFSGPGAIYKSIMLNGPGPIINIDNNIIHGVNKFIQLQNGPKCLPEIQLNTYVSMWQMAFGTVFCSKKIATFETCDVDFSNPNTAAGCIMSYPVNPANNYSAGCVTDMDWSWRIFRNFYITERNKLISRYLNTNAPVFPHPYLNNDNPKYELRFVDYDNPTQNINTDDLENSEIKNILQTAGESIIHGTSQATALQQQQYDAVCEAYATTWLSELKSCPSMAVISPENETWLLERLKAICKGGADENHSSGSSSVKTGSGGVTINAVTYFEFPDVIREYLSTKVSPPINAPYTSECFPWLITVPKPYTAQPENYNSLTLTKPTVCECNKLEEIKQERINANYSGDLSSYFKYKYQINISQGSLDTLSMLCNGTYTCNFLPNPITIPWKLNCDENVNNIKACIDCEGFATIKTEFTSLFNADGPLANPATDEQLEINISFQKFANYKTGFNKNWQEYVAFMDSCKWGTPCDSLNAIIADFKNYYNAGNNGMAYRDIKITPVVEELITGINGLLQRKHQYTHNYSLGNKFNYIPLNTKVNNRFYSMSYTPYSLEDSVFNVVIPVNVDYLWWYYFGPTPITNYLPTFKANQVVASSDFWHTPSLTELSKKYYGYTLMEEWGRFRMMFSELEHWEEPNHIYTSQADYYGVNAPHSKFLMPNPPATNSSLANAYFAFSFFKVPATPFAFADYVTEYNSIHSEIYNTSTEPEDDRLPTGSLRVKLKTSTKIYQNEDIKAVIGFFIDKPLYDDYKANATAVVQNGNGMFMRAKLLMMNGSVEDAYFFAGTNILFKEIIDSNLYNPNCSLAFSYYYNQQTGSNYTYAQIDSIYYSKCGVHFNPCTTNCGVLSDQTYNRFSVAGCASNSKPMLCGLNDIENNLPIVSSSTCEDLPQIALGLAEEKYALYIDSLRNVFDTAYYNKCMAAKDLESFKVSYQTSEYHYTLYYYDQAGNLVKTVPPAGVDAQHNNSIFLDNVRSARTNPALPAVVPNHRLATEYRYNTLNQVLMQKTPDAGISKFWYDRLGRLVVSQNAKQATSNRYSFTEYDVLGRITQVGQKPNSTAMTQVISRDKDALNTWINGTVNKEQITRTVYDVSYYNGETPSTIATYLQQTNLRNRVSYTQVFDTEPTGASSTKWSGAHTAATYYSYDIHGNVDILLQDYGSSTVRPNHMNLTANRFKKITYDYDLISGKVNEVAYQPGLTDAFYHRYHYDAENRLTEVETSRDKLIWEKEARYSYYRHGPLARTIIGQNQVQGLDYAYTLQGWLKGVNSTNMAPAYNKLGLGDMGQDGYLQNGVVNQVAKDVFGFSLGYYQNDSKNIADYKPIAASTNLAPFANPGAGGAFTSLYNGNIAAIGLNIPKLGAGMLYNYKYDQLNRLVSMSTYKNLNATTNKWTANATQDYRETISYDANGNILTYNRNGTESGAGLNMDKLTYQYPKYANTPENQTLNRVGKIINNRLRYVQDAVATSGYTEDISSQTSLTASQVLAERLAEQATDNYAYDEIGNLIKDTKEGITNITWNVYGKIESITKTSGTISYSYDASGNRISKTANNKTTWYVRDASGNVMSVYESEPFEATAKITQTEVHLYGSSRIGVFNDKINVEQVEEKPLQRMTIFTRGNKFFELNNHLGNVLATVSDKKIGVDDGVYNLTTGQQTSATPDGKIDYYTAEVVTATDYAPFGMELVGRKFRADGSYRYGFNGKENDNEVKGEGNQQDYGMRPYDDRLARLISVDPLTHEYPFLTPFQFAENNPVENIDYLGMQGNSTVGRLTPTIPRLEVSNSVVSASGSISNPTQLIHGSINSGAYSPQTKFISQSEFESIVPPYGGATINLDGVSATVFNANGNSWQVSLLKKEVRVLNLAQMVKEGRDQFKAYSQVVATMEFKKSILTEKITPLVINSITSYERITTDAKNLKASDILAIRDRISKGTATDQDKIYAARLVAERINYQINDKHDPIKPAGGANASVIPSNHAELWDNRTTYDKESDVWWSIEGKGNKAIFHRFQGDGNGTYHWSGSTSKSNVNRKGKAVKPISTNTVPSSTKKKAGFGG